MARAPQVLVIGSNTFSYDQIKILTRNAKERTVPFSIAKTFTAIGVEAIDNDEVRVAISGNCFILLSGFNRIQEMLKLDSEADPATRDTKFSCKALTEKALTYVRINGDTPIFNCPPQEKKPHQNKPQNHERKKIRNSSISGHRPDQSTPKDSKTTETQTVSGHGTKQAPVAKKKVVKKQPKPKDPVKTTLANSDLAEKFRSAGFKVK